MIGNDCRCPGCGTCDAASEVRDLRKSLREWKQKYAELSRMNESYIKNLHAAERERDELKSRLAHAEADAEQAIHNEAFMERQRIAEWLRTASRARGVLISIHSSQDIARCADAIENGEHTR